MANKEQLESALDSKLSDIMEGNVQPQVLTAMNDAMTSYLEYHLTSLWRFPTCDCTMCAAFPETRKNFRDIHHILGGMTVILSENPIIIKTGWLEDLHFLISITRILYNDSISYEGKLNVNAH